MKLLHDHVVVLMLENRSFDHIFGYLGIGDGLAKVKAVNYLKPGDKSSTAFSTRRGGDFVAIGQGPSHSLKEVNEQLYDQNDVLELYPKVKKDASKNALFEDKFLSDVAADGLATYSFIVPAFLGSHQQPVNSMHAPADVRPAEKLVADVYTALRGHPEVWRKTLFIVVFDEHGGYYDHVRPPAAVSPDGIPGRTDQSFLVPFAFNRLGVRV